MAKERGPQPDAKRADAKSKPNPLGAIGRKPSSYVGDLDSLLAEMGEGPAVSRMVGEPREQSGTAKGGGEGTAGADAQAYPSETTAGKAEPQESKPQMKRINLDVPIELHQRFKGMTGMKGRTMTEVLQELIREYLDRASR